MSSMHLKNIPINGRFARIYIPTANVTLRRGR